MLFQKQQFICTAWNITGFQYIQLYLTWVWLALTSFSFIKKRKWSLTLCEPMDCSLPGFPVHGIFPGKNTGEGCHFLLQEIFLTQGLNPGLLHFRQTLYRLSHQGRAYNSSVWVDCNIAQSWPIPEAPGLHSDLNQPELLPHGCT